MGNDAKFICFDCNQEHCLGRAYHFNSEVMNKRIKPDALEQLQLAVKRFEVTLQKVDLFGEDYYCDFFEDELEFLKEHKSHNVWIVDNYFSETEQKRKRAKR